MPAPRLNCRRKIKEIAVDDIVTLIDEYESKCRWMMIKSRPRHDACHAGTLPTLFAYHFIGIFAASFRRRIDKIKIFPGVRRFLKPD